MIRILSIMVLIFACSLKEHQMTHQGSYEPVPYHVYQQQQYASPFESRANPQMEKGKPLKFYLCLLFLND